MKNMRSMITWSAAAAAMFAVSTLNAADLASEVSTIFANSCVDCHSQAKNRMENGLDLTDLVAVAGSKKIINPESLESGKLYQKVSQSKMPPQDDELVHKPPLNDKEKNTIIQWIKQGAPLPQGAVDTSGRFIPTKTTINEIFRDLLDADENDRPSIRYLTLTVEYNGGDPDAKLEDYRNAIRKLLNSLSRKPKMAQIRAVGTGQTLLRFDLRDVGWLASKWDYIVSRYPYGVEYAGQDAGMLRSAGGSPLVQIRADWFAFAATRPENYHFLLDLPPSAQELEHSLGIDVAGNIQNLQAVRAAIGPKRSGISDHNRLVEHHEIENYGGAYWKSYDFASDTGLQYLIDRPLGPGSGDAQFQHNGGEIIFNLPNGFQAYLLVDAKGKRINTGPQNIVNDRTSLQGTEVINGLSCIKCHVNGMLPVTDEVRERLNSSPASYPANAQRIIAKLYPGNTVFQKALDDSSTRFSHALAGAVVEQAANVEPITILVRRFLRPLTIKNAHAEVGLPPEQFVQRLAKALALAGIRDDLEKRDVSRENFIEQFQTLVIELGLGRPLMLRTNGKNSNPAPPEISRTLQQNPPPAPADGGPDIAKDLSLRLAKAGNELFGLATTCLEGVEYFDKFWDRAEFSKSDLAEKKLKSDVADLIKAQVAFKTILRQARNDANWKTSIDRESANENFSKLRELSRALKSSKSGIYDTIQETVTIDNW